MKLVIVVLSLVVFSQSRVVPGYSVGSTTGYPSFTTEFNDQVSRYSVPNQSQHVQQYGQLPVQTLVQQILGQNVIQQQQTPLVVSQQTGYRTTVPQTQFGYLNQNQDTTQLLGLVQQILEENNVQRQLHPQQQQTQYGLGQLFGQSPVQASVQQILGQNGIGQQVGGLSGHTVGGSGQVTIPQIQLGQLGQQQQNGEQNGVPQQVGILTQLVNAIQSSQPSGQNLNHLGGYPVGHQDQQVQALLQQVLGQQVYQTTPTYNQVVVHRPTVGQQGVTYPGNSAYAY